MCRGLMARHDDQAGHQDPGLNRGRAPGRDAKARKGSKLALDSLGPANELVVDLIISNTEGH